MTRQFGRLSLLLLLLAVPASAARAQGSPAWAQRVAYEMDVTLRTDRHQMEGFQRLRYTNNSPDTLDRVFYHLYFNAFQPGSMMAERNRRLLDPDSRIVPRIFELGPDEVGYHRVEALRQDGIPVSFRIDDTVMEVRLAESIPPGASTVFEMAFRSQVPLQTRRSGRDNLEGIDYSMSQWYPKIAAYDERGWHPDPYVGREFYAPYGTFEVRITLPADYVVGATGVLQNAEEIGHGYQAGSTSTRPGPAASGADSLTWHFRAENVHDFAWVADPDYLHERVERDGITYHLLYQPDVAEQWEPMSTWVPELIAFYSREIGPYPYPQFTVAQAGDGAMEYPMINFLTGRRSRSSLMGATAHEAAHEWFYGVLGSNEADYAWIDEGFTSYATTEAVAHLTGIENPSHHAAYLNVLQARHRGLFEKLNTPSDFFDTNAAYGTAAYSGGQMLLAMLGYVVSDSLRDAFLHAYYDRFLFRHPNPFDVEKVAEDVSGLRLDWYFEQFANSTRSLDYAVESLRSVASGDRFLTTVVLEREHGAVMPVDLRLTFSDGSVQWINIPLSIMQGHKPVPADWIVAEPWSWTFPRYTLALELPKRVVLAEIDPLGRTPEATRLNNASRVPVRTALFEPAYGSWDAYDVGYRPLLTYARDHGAGIGVRAEGAYLFGQHAAEGKLTVFEEVLRQVGDPFLHEETSVFDAFDYELAYRRDLPGVHPSAHATASSRKQLGFLENRIGFGSDLGRFPLLRDTRRQLSVALVHQVGMSRRSFAWFDGRPLADVHLVYGRVAAAVVDGPDYLRAALDVGASLDDGDGYAANRVTLEAQKTASLGPLAGRAQLLAGAGARDLALHRRFRLGTASLEQAWRSDAYRSIAGALDDPFAEPYFMPLQGPGPVAYGFAAAGATGVAGTRVLAGTLALGAAPLPRGVWLRPLFVEAFAGAGRTWAPQIAARPADAARNQLLADAGVGVTYDVSALPPIARWTAQSDVLSGLRLTARFPLWVSHPELIEDGQDPVAFRWRLGLQL